MSFVIILNFLFDVFVVLESMTQAVSVVGGILSHFCSFLIFLYHFPWNPDILRRIAARMHVVGAAVSQLLLPLLESLALLGGVVDGLIIINFVHFSVLRRVHRGFQHGFGNKV